MSDDRYSAQVRHYQIRVSKDVRSAGKVLWFALKGKPCHAINVLDRWRVYVRVGDEYIYIGESTSKRSAIWLAVIWLHVTLETYSNPGHAAHIVARLVDEDSHYLRQRFALAVDFLRHLMGKSEGKWHNN